MPNTNHNHRIRLSDATTLTAAWRKSAPGDIKAGMFARAAVEEILAVPGCAGLRIYPGRKPDGRLAFVLVPTDSAGNDLLIPDTSGEPLIQEECVPCPPLCSETNALNT